MVVASKLFEWPINQFHCSQIPIHQGRTCFQSFFYDCYRFTLSGLRYYSPLVLAPILLKRNKLDKATLSAAIRFYLETVYSSTFIVAFSFAMLCLLRNLNGKFTVSTFLLGIYLGAQYCWFMPSRSYKLFMMGITQVALEVVLKQWKNPFTYHLLHSGTLQTLWFMLSSAVLMHFKRNRQYNGFWFIQPQYDLGQNAEEVESKTGHSIKQILYSLKKFLLKDASTSLVYGLSCDILSALLKTSFPRKLQQLPGFITRCLVNTKLKMTGFFVSYICLYRLALYFPFKTIHLKAPVDCKHFAASFFGGLSYVFVNKLTINTFAFILAVQALWQSLCQTSCNEEIKRRNVFETLKAFPFSKVLFPFSATCTIYAFILYNESVNGLGKALLRAVTDDKIQRIYEFLSKNSDEIAIKTAASIQVLGAF